MLIDENLKALKGKDPELSSTYRPPRDCEILRTEAGYPTMRFKGTLLHSTHNPVEEARRLIERYDLASKDLVIVFGLGLGYHLVEILKRGKGLKFILLIEPSPDIFWAALEYVDLREFIASPCVQLSIGEETSRAVERFKERFDILRMASPCIIEHPPSTRLNQDYFKDLRTRINDSIGLKILQAKTLCRFGWNFQQNIIKNIPEMIHSPGIKNLFGKFEGMPSLIIGAGPSLDISIDGIKMAKEKALLIAADTALKTLLDRGISPDLVVVVDPQEVNIEYLNGIEEGDHFLVVGSTAHHRIPSLGGQKFFFRTDHPICRWFSTFDDKGFLRTGGGSVVNVAFDLATRLGVDPVVLVGCDFSFPEGLPYTKGVLEGKGGESWMDRLNKFLTIEMIRREYLKEEDLFAIPGKSGGSVPTNRTLYSYLRELESEILRRKGRPHVINASNGAAIKGTEVMGLEDVIKQWVPKIDPRRIIKRGHLLYEGFDFSLFFHEIDTILEDLGRIEHLRDNEIMGKTGLEKTMELLNVLLYSLCFEDLFNKEEERGMILARGVRTAAHLTRELFEEMRREVKKG